MENNSFDYTLIGNNFHSLIMGMKIVNKKKSSLIIDDSRINVDYILENRADEFTRIYLQMWGIVEELPPLVNIDDYLTTQDVQFDIGNKKLQITDNPYLNLVEIARKFPRLFQGSIDEILNLDEQSFNDEVSTFVDRFCELQFRFRNLNSFENNFSNSLISFPFNNLLNNFNTNVSLVVGDKSEEFLVEKIFIDSARGFYFNELSESLETIEIFHLFINLLFPFYTVNAKALKEDLFQIYLDRGGEYKKCKINSFHIPFARLENIELDSYEGVIDIDRCMIFGDADPSFDLSTKFDNHDYKFVEVNFILDEFEQKKLKYTYSSKSFFIFADKNTYGSKSPFLIGRYKNEKSLVFAIPIEKSTEISEGKIVSHIKKSFKNLLSIDPPQNYFFDYSKAFFMFDHKNLGFSQKRKLVFINNRTVFDRSPVDKVHIENIDIWSKERRFSLGNLTFLAGIKDIKI